MTIGSRIRKQRELIGLTQTELAEKVKISKQTLYKYEKNIITNIPSNKIEEISKVLRVSEAYLMGWEDKIERVTTAERLKQLMREQNLKQVDILNLTLPICAKYNIKMNKSDISQYVSGKVEPSQEKLSVLGMALNVTETWLMGFDVPPERKDTVEKATKDFDIYYKYSLLDERDKKIVLDMINSMLARKKSGVN